MKSCAVAAVFLLTLPQPADEAAKGEPAAKEELRKFDGAWVMTSIAVDPPDAKPADADRLRVAVKNGVAAVGRPGETEADASYVLAVDPTKSPMTIDVRPQGEKDAKPVLGIYELKGDVLRVCWAGEGRERPTEFKAEPGSGRGLAVLRREKATAKE
jgi:uncharacterized protein (TIGR03067 family)